MNSMKSLAAVFALLAVAACNSTPELAKGGAAQAWQVDAAQSSLNFVTTKAGQAGVGGIGEVQSFGQFTGGLTAAGQVSFNVTLASVATGVGIRDERMRTMLFNVGSTPVATFTAQIEPALLRGLVPGAAQDVDVEGQFTLAGQSKPLNAKLRVVRLAAGKLSVATRAPIMVDANQFGLKSGVESLREIMGLNFLASTAPVSFQLMLNEKS